MSYGTENCFNAANAEYISVAKLDATHFVVAYKDTGGDGYGCARVGSVSGGVITYGAENIFNSAITDHISVAALDSTHFVVSYRDDGGVDYGCARIGVVSGTTISSYGTENCFNTANTQYISVAALDTTHFVVAYRDIGNSDYGTAIIGMVSGSTITYGSEYVFNSVVSSHLSVATLDSTHFVVAYLDIDNLSYGIAIIGSVSDSVITYGSTNTFNSASTGFPSVAALDSTHFVVAYRDYGGDSHGCARVGLVSGTTISSYGTENCFNLSGTQYCSVAALDSTHFVVAYRDYGGVDYGYSRVATVSGTTISSYDTVNTFNAATTIYIGVAALNSNDFVVVYKDDGGADYGCARVWVGLHELVSTIAATTATSASALDVLRELESAIAATTSISVADLKVLRELLTTVATITSTSSSDVDVLRELESAIASVTATSPPGMAVLRELTSTIPATTLTSSILLDLIRELTSTIDTTTSTSASALDVLRELDATIASQISLSDIELLIENIVEFSTTIATTTSTSAVDVDVIRELIATIDTTTSISVASLDALRELIASIDTTTALSDIELLIVWLRELATTIASTTATSIVDMAVLRGLTASVDTTTSLSSATLNILREFSSTISAETSTSDVSMVILRSLTSQIATGTDVSTATILVLRELSATVPAETLTNAITLVVVLSRALRGTPSITGMSSDPFIK